MSLSALLPHPLSRRRAERKTITVYVRRPGSLFERVAQSSKSNESRFVDAKISG
jgi:hypothetical protein